MDSHGTRLETDEEVRQAVQAVREGLKTNRAPTKSGGPAGGGATPAPAEDLPPLFRPMQRPPMAVLTVFDDGSSKGETLRIRGDRFTIGRTEGEFVIPHDAQMSGRHAELRRSLAKERYKWFLIDLESTNGTYVRVGHALLQHGQQFVIGQTRFRFDHPPAPDITAKREGAEEPSTRAWRTGPLHELMPSLVEMAGPDDGPRVVFTQREIWLGKDAANCQVVLRDDPFVSARHARIRCDDGRWIIENNKSLNGVWLRIEQIALKGSCQFLLGEQRFAVKVPS